MVEQQQQAIVGLIEIEPWVETSKLLESLKVTAPQLYSQRMHAAFDESHREFEERLLKESTREVEYPIDQELNQKISLFTGDITKVAVDCITNSSNAYMTMGSGVSFLIHQHSGDPHALETLTRNALLEKRQMEGGKVDDLQLQTAEVVITDALQLPCKKILHVLTPPGRDDELSYMQLGQCYYNCLELMKNASSDNLQLRSIAFCCLGCGKSKFSIVDSAHAALRTIRDWLQMNKNVVDRIVFVVNKPQNQQVYEVLLPLYFPC